jgi:hypothetical protein
MRVRDAFKKGARLEKRKGLLFVVSGLLTTLALGVIAFLYGQIALSSSGTVRIEDLFFEGILFAVLFLSTIIVLPHWRDLRTLCLGVLLFLLGSYSDLLDEYFKLPALL